MHNQAFDRSGESLYFHGELVALAQRTLIAIVATLVAAPAGAADLTFKKSLVGNLIKQVPAILKTYHAESGRFGSGIFICSDQNVMYPLAVAYFQNQWAHIGLDGLNSDLIASLLQYGEEGRVAAHLTLIPHLKQLLETGAGQRITLGETPIALSAEQVGGSITHAGCRLHLPETASLRWPVLPHNPYRKDGRATAAEGRIVICIPLDAKHRAYTIGLEVLP